MKPRGKLIGIIKQGHEEEVSRERARETERRTGGYCFKFVWFVHTPGNGQLVREEVEATSSKQVTTGRQWPLQGAGRRRRAAAWRETSQERRRQKREEDGGRSGVVSRIE